MAQGLTAPTTTQGGVVDHHPLNKSRLLIPPVKYRSITQPRLTRYNIPPPLGTAGFLGRISVDESSPYKVVRAYPNFDPNDGHPAGRHVYNKTHAQAFVFF